MVLSEGACGLGSICGCDALGNRKWEEAGGTEELRAEAPAKEKSKSWGRGGCELTSLFLSLLHRGHPRGGLLGYPPQEGPPAC